MFHGVDFLIQPDMSVTDYTSADVWASPMFVPPSLRVSVDKKLTASINLLMEKGDSIPTVLYDGCIHWMESVQNMIQESFQHEMNEHVVTGSGRWVPRQGMWGYDVEQCKLRTANLIIYARQSLPDMLVTIPQDLLGGLTELVDVIHEMYDNVKAREERELEAAGANDDDDDDDPPPGMYSFVNGMAECDYCGATGPDVAEVHWGDVLCSTCYDSQMPDRD